MFGHADGRRQTAARLRGGNPTRSAMSWRVLANRGRRVFNVHFRFRAHRHDSVFGIAGEEQIRLLA